MRKETILRGSEFKNSFHSLLRVLYRRKSVVRQAFTMVFVLGALSTFTTRPVYQSSARILVEGRQFSPNVNSSNPLDSIMVGDLGHDIDTQIAPNGVHDLIQAGLIGILLGICVAFLLEFCDRITTRHFSR